MLRATTVALYKGRFPALRTQRSILRKVYASNPRSKILPAREIERSDLTHAISRDKFHSRHWPLLAYVAFLVKTLRCVRKAVNRA